MKIIISLLVVLGLLSSQLEQSNAQVFELIKQYHECKYLQMYLTTDWRGPYFIRNESTPNNTLDDSFYQTLGLENMTFTQGMNFLRNIYTETANCKTTFCNCTKFWYIDQKIENSIYFRNYSNFLGMKSIIWAFNNKYKASLKSLNTNLNSNNRMYPTLVKFQMTFEYTWEKLRFYNEPLFCYAKNATLAYQNYDSCLYFKSISKRKFITNPTNAQLMAQMICPLMSYTNCSSIEYRRFNVIKLWVDQFPRLKFTGKSMSKFFDRLVDIARNYKPTLYLTNLYANLFRDKLSLSSYKQHLNTITSNQTEWYLMLLNSTKLRIDTQINRINGSNYFTWVNFTFYLPTTSNPSILTFNVNNSYSSFQNGTIVKDSKGTNIYQYFNYQNQIFVYDFNTNSKVIINMGYIGYVNIVSPIKLMDVSNGALLDALNNTSNSSGRKKREIGHNNECEIICKRIVSAKSMDYSNEFYLKSVFENCLKDCMS